MKKVVKNGLVLLLSPGTTGDCPQGSPCANGVCPQWCTAPMDVLIDGNRIARVAPGIPTDGCDMIDAAGKLVMPGLINAHTHVYMTIHRNYADDLAFFEWLDKVQKVEDGMTEEDIYWTTLLGIIEMIRSGTTCFVDMTIKSAQEMSGPRSAAAGAVKESGFRAAISRGLAGVSDSDESIMKFGQAVREMEMFRDEPRLQFLHGPHAPYSCMPDYLRKLTQSSRERGIGQTIHLSESQTEMETIARDRGGMTPIQYVDSEGEFLPGGALRLRHGRGHCTYGPEGRERGPLPEEQHEAWERVCPGAEDAGRRDQRMSRHRRRRQQQHAEPFQRDERRGAGLQRRDPAGAER